MIKLLDCKCGSSPHPAEWSGCVEYDGCTYQSCMVMCKDCDADISINVNTDLNYDTFKFENYVSNLWNLVNKE